MRRLRALLSICILAFTLVSGLSQPVAASPGGKGAAACSHGGYRAYTDSAGNAFKNAGQCTRYVAGGGVLIPLPNLTVTWTDVVGGVFEVDVTGYGLEPGAILYVDTDLGTKIDVFMVDSSGNLSFHGGYYPCGTFAWFEYSTLTQSGAPIATRVATPC